MEKFLHKPFIVLRKLSVSLLLAGFCCMLLGFAYRQQASPSSVQVVKCYPNPATSFVNFEFPKTIDKSNSLHVFSFVGKKMAEMPISTSKITITLNDYYRGVYVYQLRDKGGNIVESGKFSVIK